MFDYAWKNITRRMVRSILTVIGLMVMLALVIVISRIVDYQKVRMNQHAAAGTSRIVVQSFLAGTGYPGQGVDMPNTTAGQLLALPYLQKEISAAVFFFPLAAPPYPNEPPALILAGVEPGKEKSFTGSIVNETQVEIGQTVFTPTGGSPLPQVILGKKARAYFEKKLARKIGCGTNLDILGRSFQVIGCLGSSPDRVVENAVIMPLPLAQTLLDKQGFVTGVILFPRRADQQAGILARICAGHPHLVCITAETMVRNAREGIKLFEQMINTICLVVISAAVILLVTVMMMTIKERTREIGVLRAIGARPGLIILALFWELLLLSGLGTILGAGVAGVILRFGLLENLFSLSQLVSYLPCAIAIAVIAGVAPAWRILQIRPVEALLYE